MNVPKLLIYKFVIVNCMCYNKDVTKGKQVGAIVSLIEIPFQLLYLFLKSQHFKLFRYKSTTYKQI